MLLTSPTSVYSNVGGKIQSPVTEIPYCCQQRFVCLVIFKFGDDFGLLGDCFDLPACGVGVHHSWNFRINFGSCNCKKSALGLVIREGSDVTLAVSSAGGFVPI